MPKELKEKVIYTENFKSFDLSKCVFVWGFKLTDSGEKDYSESLLLTPQGNFITGKDCLKDHPHDFRELDKANVVKWLKDHNRSISSLPAPILKKLDFQKI